MRLTDSATEQTAAATDVLLAAAALACAGCLLRYRPRHRLKVDLWAAAFALLAVAGLIGAVIHGLVLEPQTRALLWRPVHLSLGLTIALFVTAAVLDRFGDAAARRCLPVMLLVGVAFFAVTWLLPVSFRFFLAYEAVAMLFALGVYLYLGMRRFDGAWWMVAGVLLSIVAAAVQASPARLTLWWEFDRNGLFHLAQIVALAALLAGLRTSLRSGSPQSGGP
jgi:hypothetical protein